MSPPATFEHVMMEVFAVGAAFDVVLEHNYMFHREIYQDVGRLLARRCEPFTILDLGCGTARDLARAIHGLPVSGYRGIDLADSALQEARRNLAHLTGLVELRCGDMLRELENVTRRQDVIFSGFSLHHLTLDEKAVFLEHARRLLREGGLMILIDTARPPGTDRQTHLDDYCRWVRETWNALPPEAKDAVCRHVQECDFPETTDTIHDLAERAGFAGIQEVNHFNGHHTWCFTKS